MIQEHIRVVISFYINVGIILEQQGVAHRLAQTT